MSEKSLDIQRHILRTADCIGAFTPHYERTVQEKGEDITAIFNVGIYRAAGELAAQQVVLINCPPTNKQPQRLYMSARPREIRLIQMHHIEAGNVKDVFNGGVKTPEELSSVGQLLEAADFSHPEPVEALIANFGADEYLDWSQPLVDRMPLVDI